MNVIEKKIKGNFENVLELNESELHDIISSLYHFGNSEHVSMIQIISKSNDVMSNEDRLKWQSKMKDLIEILQNLDCEFHDQFDCL